MQWDPYTTLRRALWIGGGQWAGKTTVSGILAEEFGITHYHYDYHATRGHRDRQIAQQVRRGEAPTEPDGEAIWIRPTPRRMAQRELADFRAGFEWIQDDLRALVSTRPILVDGWALRPELVAAITASTRQMVVLVPTEEFRQSQIDRLPRAGAVGLPVSDPALAQRNRIERDRLIAQDAVHNAERLGIRVIEIDGTRDAQAVAELVAEHFQPFLPSRCAPGS